MQAINISAVIPADIHAAAELDHRHRIKSKMISRTETLNTESKINNKPETLAAIRGCIPVLEMIADRSELLALLPEPERIALIIAAGKISQPDRKEIKKRNNDFQN
jgi:hypothetical protein